MVRTKSLAFATGVGGVFVSLSCFYMDHKIKERISRMPANSKAIDVLMRHEQAMNALGPPVKIGGVRWTNTTDNYATEHKCKFIIPVAGRQDAGNLRVFGKRRDNDWHLAVYLELIANDKTYLVFEDAQFGEQDD